MPDWTITVEAEFEDDEAYDALKHTDQWKLDEKLKQYVEDTIMPLDLERSEFDGHMVTFNVKVE
jgi:hypothetical protein